MDTQDTTNDVVPLQDNNKENLSRTAPVIVVSRRSGGQIRKPRRYVLLGDSFERVPKDWNTKYVNYDKALQGKDAGK